MKHRWFGLIFVLLFCFTAPAFADRILAVVGDEVITESELDKMVRLWQYNPVKRLELTDKDLNEGEIKKRALERLIEEKLLYLKAKENDITVPADAVERRIEQIKSRYNTEEDFIDSLKESHLTLQELYDLIERQLMVRKVVSKYVRSRIYINPIEVEKEYKRHKKDFCVVTMVKLDSIFIPRSMFKDDSEMAFDSAVMDEYIKLKQGSLTWKDLTAKYGKGQVSGWKSRKDLSKEIAEVLFKPDVEMYPLPVRVSTGYILFRIEDKRKNCPKSLGEAREMVYNYIYNKKFEKRLDEFVQELKKRYYVKINLGT